VSTFEQRQGTIGLVVGEAAGSRERDLDLVGVRSEYGRPRVPNRLVGRVWRVGDYRESWRDVPEIARVVLDPPHEFFQGI